MTLDEIVASLARRLGVSRLEPASDGSYHLAFDDNLQVRVFTRGRSDLFLVGRIGRLPSVPGDAEARLREVLQRSLGLMRVRPEVVGLDPEGDEIVLHRRFDLAATDGEAFATALGEFLDELEGWTGTSAPSRPQGPPPMMIFP
jgi:hypothetical protein